MSMKSFRSHTCFNFLTIHLLLFSSLLIDTAKCHPLFNHDKKGALGSLWMTVHTINRGGGKADTDTETDPVIISSTSEAARATIDPKKAISVQKTIEVPFDVTTAFNAFSDLPRQAEYSPWIRYVQYIKPVPSHIDRGTLMGTEWQTRWCVGLFGFAIRWKANVTKIERPSLLEWESVSGMKNYGRVVFSQTDDDSKTTLCTMTMTFIAPSFIASLFRKSTGLRNYVQNQMVAKTLRNYRDIVAKECGITTD